MNRNFYNSARAALDADRRMLGAESVCVNLLLSRVRAAALSKSSGGVHLLEGAPTLWVYTLGASATLTGHTLGYMHACLV